MTVPENPIGGWNATYVNDHVDILYSYNVCFAVQYLYIHFKYRYCL